MLKDFSNLILSNTGLIVTSLVLIAILVAALVFVIKVKHMQHSKTS